ncbi:MAG: class I SAM-dependent methyltransferase [Cyclobacteriaceae bacterium]
MFEFYNHVIRPTDPARLSVTIRDLLENAKNDERKITRRDLGAGSRAHGREVSVATLARYSTSSAASRQLLANLIRWTSAENILELGTSMGITTLTMAESSPDPHIHSIEGCPQTAAIARELVSSSGQPGISLYEGNIDDRLPGILNNMKKVDLAYLDANHRYEPTVDYFNQLLPCLHKRSVVVIGDISWSRGMQQAWQEIRQHPNVTASADLLEAGVLFFRPLPYRMAYAMAMPRASAAR